ncbi:hypothetical protein H5410_063917 [Solanum commersonii]|uniref:Uncharacterized protein n=1 Tax=Solanum commersonii TaxID=4109 RepID=A0A9J5WFM7_SOLCO|nr:hypothetical protein H5410_063917 [Solanum commersonii]
MHDEFSSKARVRTTRTGECDSRIGKIEKFIRELNLWIGDKKSGMCFKIEEKGRSERKDTC